MVTQVSDSVVVMDFPIFDDRIDIAHGVFDAHQRFLIAVMQFVQDEVEHLKEIQLTIEEGSEVLAYCTWSFTALLSCLNGYQKRYGFVYVDQYEEAVEPSLKRYKKDRYFWYKDVIASDGTTVFSED